MILFWVCFILVFWTYVGYPTLIISLSKFIPSRKYPKFPLHELPSISVLISAYNEEGSIIKRVENILRNGYPPEKLEIILASDGSRDGTVMRVRDSFNQGVLIQDHEENRGRAAVQNDGVSAARGQVIIFTDAGTEFGPGFLSALIQPFSEKTVGCVVGNLIYKASDRSVSDSESKYFAFEKKIREAESKIGILATGTGACMAVRKSLWRELTSIDDCDFTTPIDVILQNCRVVYQPVAVAYDQPTSTIKGEIKVRIRQTSKNFMGTLKRWRLRGWIQHPFTSFALLSHKLLKWLTPFFLLGCFLSTLFLVRGSYFFQIILLCQLVFCLMAVIGLIGDRLNVKVPLASMVLSFCVAN
ncbi:MAG: glycosyltransferase, partial [Desulfobacterales bacterium]|nr:glycosyltransferase [Desulfobacterales bacterium]